MRVRDLAAAQWLYRLDSYTNAEFGCTHSMCAFQDECVGCGEHATTLENTGLCARCTAQRQADTAHRKRGMNSEG